MVLLMTNKQKLHEYNKAMANEDKDIIEAKKEKKKNQAIFFL